MLFIIVDESQANSKKAQDIVDRMTFSLNKQAKKFSEWNDTIANKLELLRNKITQAHHIANGVCNNFFYNISFSK